ncbi:MAG: peptide deformylase [Magnetococcales bacterium]|nr:peptide deformylase [Magnetococcales bacterium]
MARMKILTALDKRLRLKAAPVALVDDSVRQLMDDMLETMYAAPGVGLAAPQVGVSKRVIVLDVEYGKEGAEKNPLCLANPRVVEFRDEIVWEEGCLSVPEFFEKVTRHAWVKVEALDRNNQLITVEGEGLLAVCLQHEIEHLDGGLFIDHISRLKREIILKKLKKKMEEKA